MSGGTVTSKGAASIVVGDRSMRGRSALSAYAPIPLVVALLAIVPLVVGDSRTYMGLAFSVLVFAGYAISFNVVFGLTGQLFLCLGALAGVGGYGVAILSDAAGLPLAVSLPLPVVLAGALGAVFSYVSVARSLDVIFTGIVTLTFSLAFENLLLGQRELTGGETGLVVEAAADTALDDLVGGYLIMLAVVALFLVAFRLLQRSHFGWAFKALRDDEMTAELAGVDVTRYRIWAGGIGSGMIGLVGALQALHQGFISPSTFAFGHVDVETLVILAFGGIATMMGPIIGAVSFGVIDELVRDLGQLRVAVYGAILLALFLGMRGGVGPTVLDAIRRIRSR